MKSETKAQPSVVRLNSAPQEGVNSETKAQPFKARLSSAPLSETAIVEVAQLGLSQDCGTCPAHF
jgi:hypothetical protein